MRIGVVLRLVPDLSGDIELTTDGRALDLEWMDVKLNEFDDQALEEAVLLKEATGATVVAIALEGEGVDRMLQGALARGADEVVKVTTGSAEELDSRAASPVLAEAIGDLGVDLVLTGVQTSADIFGQLAGYLGATLGWRHASAVAGTRVTDNAIEVQQEHSGGIASVLALDLPAVLGIQAASRPPRYVSGSRLRQFATAAIPVRPAMVAALAPGAELMALREPDRGQGAEMLGPDAEEAAAQIVEILKARGLVEG
jgi:electron transfer flavoprotein beta subunit